MLCVRFKQLTVKRAATRISTLFAVAADHRSPSTHTDLKMAPSFDGDMLVSSEEGVFIAPDMKSDGARTSRRI